MKRIYIFLFFLLGQVLSFQLKAQTTTENELSQELTQISDSIYTHQEKGDDAKVLSFCENGIALLSENNLVETPFYCSLCLIAGESCMNLKNYYGAQFYYFRSFIYDELCDLGIGVYSAIEEKAKEDNAIFYFKKLIGIVKSDTTVLNELVTEPQEFAYRLNSLALEYFNKSEYASAIDFFEMKRILLEILDKYGNEDYLSVLSLEISCYIQLARYDLAMSYADFYINLAESKKSKGSIEYAQGLREKADVEAELGNYNNAIKFYEESLSLIETIKGKNNMDYINGLRQLGYVYMLKDGNPIKNLEIQLNAEELLAKTASATVDDKAYNLMMLSNCYYQMADYDQSLTYAKKAVDLIKADGQVKSVVYASALKDYSRALIAKNDYVEAIKVGEEAVCIYSQIDRNKEEDKSYRLSINDLSKAYFDSGDINKGISTLQTLLTDEFPDDAYKYSSYLTLSLHYQILGLKEKQKECCEKMLQLAEKISGKKSELYATALFFASDVQEKKGDAIMMLQEAEDICSEIYGVDSNNQLFVNIKHSKALIEYENNPARMFLVLNDYKKIYGENSRLYLEHYIGCLELNAHIYNDKDLYKIITKLDSVSQKIKATFTEKDELYLKVRHSLAQMNISSWQRLRDIAFYNRGVDIQTEVVSLASSLYGEDNIKYIEEVEHLAIIKSTISPFYFLFIKRDEENKIWRLYHEERNISAAWDCYKSTFISKCYDEIYELQSKVVDYWAQFKENESSKYADACRSLADYYYSEISSYPPSKFGFFYNYKDGTDFESKAEKAEDLYKIALNIYMGTMDDCGFKNSNSVSFVLQDLKWLYDIIGDIEKSAKALSGSFRIWEKENLKQLSLMTSAEKSQTVFGDHWQSRIDSYNSQAYYGCDENATYAEISYDVQLLNKGLLLKSATGLRDMILDTGNAEVISKYNRLVEISKLISKSSNETDLSSLYKESELLQRQLMKESEQYGDYMRDLSYTFTDVKSCLSNDDVAIEFAAKQDVGRDKTIHYFALVLRKDYTSPKLIKLDCDSLSDDNSIDSIYKKVWEPLIEEIKDMKNVYFSPIYELNNLPLESAKLPDGTYLSDLGVNFYRVSSTREIIRPQKQERYKSIVLYGGLDYNTDVKVLIASDAEERSNGLRGIGDLNEEIVQDLRRGSLSFKDDIKSGTKKEIEKIGNIATSCGIDTILFKDTKGTESTFKNLSGKDIDIIHLATHGFYVTPVGEAVMEPPMERSGLAMSGANHKKLGTILPEGVDDGILMAAEISRMNLRGTDLIVLSACETGLGDITGEGVFGLQRGFKMAGAQTIVMSLWKVDDAATQMLMTSFYEGYLSGMSKRESLLAAQRKVRESPGWEDPDYWAGFILLDGLD